MKDQLKRKEIILIGGGGLMGFGSMGLLGGILGLLISLAILIGIVVLIIWAVKRFTAGNSATVGQSPHEILQARYARGEVTREQYQQMLRELG